MIIEKSEIAGKLAKIRTATLDNPTIPTLQGVLVRESQLIANNLKMGITADITTETDTPFILPQKAMDMIKALPDGDIEIKPADGRIDILAAGIKNSFAGLNPEDFVIPAAPVGDSQSSKINIKVFKELVNSVIYATSNNEARPIHTGLLFDVADGIMNVVAVDGYRLAWNKVEFEGNFKFVVPKATIEKLLKLNITGDIEVLYTEKSAVIKSDAYTVYSQLLQGDFINYKESVPNHDKQIMVSLHALLGAVNRSLICADKNTKQPIIISFSGSKMILSMRTSIAEYSEEIEVSGEIDENLRIGVNGNYLHDALRTHGSDTVSIAYKANTQPLVIRDKELTSLLLPVRLSLSSS